MVELESRGVVAFMEGIEGRQETDTAIEETAKCGLEALKLAGELRSLFNFPAFSRSSEATSLMNTQLDYVKARAERNRLDGMPIIKGRDQIG